MWLQVKRCVPIVTIVFTALFLGQTFTAAAAGYINRIEYDWDTWETMPPLPRNAEFPAMAVYSNALFFMGGNTRTNVYRFNGTNWTEVTGLPQAVYGAVAGVVGGHLYLAGGMNSEGSGVSNTVFRYNGTSWTRLAGMSDARCLAAGGVIDGWLYVAFGLDSVGGLPDTTVKFNGTTWTNHQKSWAAAYPGLRLGSVVVGTNLYVSGGYYGGYLNYFQRLSGTNWSRPGDLPAARAYHASASVSGKVYVIGGRVSGGAKTALVYSYNGSGWDSPNPPSLPAAIDCLAAATYRGSIYVAGGLAAGDTNVYRYPAQSGTQGVIPESGTRNGGYLVNIIGTGLGNGSDITNVSLCGVDASSIISQSDTEVVIAAGYSSTASITGDVRVFSTSVGETVLANGFIYSGTGKTGQFISFSEIANQKTTNIVRLAATASSGLPVSFSVVSGSASISGGTNLSFSNPGEVFVKAAQAGNSTYDPANDVIRSFRVISVSPFTLRAVALTNNVILRWPDPYDYGFSNQTVLVRFSTSDYPDTSSSGSQIYTGTALTYEHTGRTPGQACYYTIFTSHDGSSFTNPP